MLQCLENYKSMFWDSKGMKWEDAQAIAKDYLGTLERVCPHLVEEMKGKKHRAPHRETNHTSRHC